MILVTFSDQNEDPWAGPSRLSKGDLKQLFNHRTGWEIRSIESAVYERDLSAKGVRGGPTGTGYAYLSHLERIAVDSNVARL
jgi:hypothetical protein